MVYICPTCKKEFINESLLTKHMAPCWKKLHPNHESMPAPHSDDIVVREVSNDIADFFASLKKG